MIQVYKCDFCHHFNQDAEKVIMHEIKCSFNPINKKCWSCKHVFEVGYPMSGSMRGCAKDLGILKGEDVGNCIGWELEQ
jgi:phage FluMu protein Com